MRRIVWIIALILFQGGILLGGEKPQDIKSRLGEFLPQEINGWKAEGKDELYDPETIFDYIDGAGEVYRSYNFLHLLVRRYIKEGRPDMVADFFDMGKPREAFGVFTHDVEGEESGVGQGSTYKGGLLSFWKDRFFVSLYAEEETEETKEALLALGQKVDASIEDEGEKPEIIYCLPPEEIVEKSIHYFHNHIILNYHFFVADENILLLDQETEAALGTYEEGNVRLLIIRYPQQERASAAYKSFIKHYMPDAQQGGVVQTEDAKWTAARINGSFVFLVFHAPSESYTLDMMERVEKKVEVRKTE
jgi:hypothetical protein